MSSLRDQILAASDVDREIVEVAEWGCKVEVRSPNGHDRAAILTVLAADDRDYKLLYPTLLLPTLYDPETGERIFGANDGEALLEKSGTVLERLAVIALKQAAVSIQDVEAGKDA